MERKDSILIDIGGSYIKKVIFNNNKFKNYEKLRTNGKDILNQLSDIIIKEIENYEILSIYIAIPGAVNYKSGIIIHAINLNLYNFNLKQYCENKFNINTFIISDRDAGLLGCLNMVKNKYNNVIALSWGTGVAISLYLNGELYSSLNNIAPEFGHNYVSDNKNFKCFCGKTGCLNATSGAKILRLKINEILNMSGDNIEYAIKVSNKNVQIEQILNDAIFYLSKSIANLYNIFEPETIIIWGGMSEFAKDKVRKINEIVKNSVHNSIKDKINIKISKYGQKTALVGLAEIVKKGFS